ncbi:MATE family efflux transporter [Phocaeicola sp. HCN-40430]|uniref:MATE family efflux transporter n=1 Tax=Phocaeicola sp. HCN-40430 TaxID=3134664 RepID=UPI0030BDC55F
MTNTTENNKRIAKNTMLLYVRMLILIGIQLYTVPIILNTLGIEDYGIYNVVGGIVTMFSFIGSSLASGSQRFIAFEIGRKNKEQLKNIFNTIITVYFVLAIIALILLEAGGYWLLNYHMKIPESRMYAANWVFQLSILSFLINLISIPYNSVVIAHEKMSVFAYISIIECIFKLIAAILLQYILFDHLITYAILICLITVIIRSIYQIYCYKRFEECQTYHFSWDSDKGKELLTYSGWNIIGTIAIISRQQGLNIIINIFFGPILNAAHSIGQQINGVITQFINNVYIATRPQITKLFANNQTAEMWNLVFRSSKLAFYLLMILSIPLLIELDKILNLWLHNVPPYSVAIGRLMILTILIETLANQIIGAYQAANKIKRYQIYSSTIILLNIPISYISLLILPSYPLTPYFISVVLSIFYTFSIIWNAKKELGMNILKYTKHVLLNVIIIYCTIVFTVWISITSFSPSIFRILLTCSITIIYSFAAIWTLGLDKTEKEFIINITLKKLHKK